MEKKAQKNKFQCEICSKLFSKKFNYHRHIRMHFLNEIMNHQHDPSLPRETLLGQFYECEKCKRKFNEKKQLTQHINKWHLGEFVCNYCLEKGVETKFQEKLDYIKHLNLNHAVKLKFECKFCGMTFRYISQYIHHKQSHHREANLNEEECNSNKCDLCGKKFSKYFNLKRHLKTRHGKNTEQRNLEESNLGEESNQQELEINKNTLPNNSRRLKYNCNLVQKKYYVANKVNFHLNKVNLNK